MYKEPKNYQISQGDVEIIEMLAGLTEQATSRMSLSIGQLSLRLSEGLLSEESEAQQVELLSRLGDATSRIASALGSVMLTDTTTEASTEDKDTDFTGELELSTDPALDITLLTEPSIEPTSEIIEDSKFDQSSMELEQELGDGYQLIDIEFELAKLFLSGEYLRIEEVKAKIPSLNKLDNKSEEYIAFKASYEGYRNRIKEYFSRLGFSATWDGKGRRRGRKYNLTIEPDSKEYVQDNTSRGPDEDTQTTVKTGVIVSTPVIRVRRTPKPEKEARTTTEKGKAELYEDKLTSWVKRAELFEDKLTSWINRYADERGSTSFRKPELARDIAQNIDGVTEAMAKVAISNIVSKEKLYKGNSEGGYSIVSTMPVEAMNEGSITEKKSQRLEFTDEMIDISKLIIDFVNNERHLELGRGIQDIVKQFESEDLDEQTIKFICRRLCDFGVLTEKQNARVGPKKKGRRSNQNVKTTRYLMKDGETRKRWVKDHEEVLLEILEKLESADDGAADQLVNVEQVLDYVDSERQLSAGKKKADIVQTLTESGLDEKEILAALSELKNAGLLILVRDARTSSSPHSSNLRVPKYKLKNKEVREKWRNSRQSTLDELRKVITA